MTADNHGLGRAFQILRFIWLLKLIGNYDLTTVPRRESLNLLFAFNVHLSGFSPLQENEDYTTSK